MERWRRSHLYLQKMENMSNKTILTLNLNLNLNLKTNISIKLKAHQIKNKDKMFDTPPITTIISIIANITTKEMG